MTNSNSLSPIVSFPLPSPSNSTYAFSFFLPSFLSFFLSSFPSSIPHLHQSPPPYFPCYFTVSALLYSQNQASIHTHSSITLNST